MGMGKCIKHPQIQQKWLNFLVEEKGKPPSKKKILLCKIL